MSSDPIQQAAWRVAVTRDEPEHGPQSVALEARGFVVVRCPVLIEAPAADDDALGRAARRLETFDWVICASVRAVRALAGVRGAPWPAGVRTAAVGGATGAALEALGVERPPIVPPVAGADALWSELAGADDWPRRRVLILTTPGGRTSLIDAFRAAGADVLAVDAYRMVPRPADDIRRDWEQAHADAVILASPRTADLLAAAVGRDALARLRAVVAVGETTAAALGRLGLPCSVAADASFDAAAEVLAARAAEVTA